MNREGHRDSLCSCRENTVTALVLQPSQTAILLLETVLLGIENSENAILNEALDEIMIIFNYFFLQMNVSS